MQRPFNLRRTSRNIDAGHQARPPRYSAAGLIAKGARNKTWPRVWRDAPLESSYDVVIIGGGVHGLACGYYLATNHGISNVAVLDKAYLGSGGSGRNTAIEIGRAHV